MIRFFLLSAALVAAACAPSPRNQVEAVAEADPAPAVARESAYAIRGEGREGMGTAWQAVMIDGRILLDSPTSAGWVSIAAPEPRLEGNRRVFATRYLTLSIEPGTCAIAVYRSSLPDRVTIEWDAGRFEGCGGPRATREQIAGTWWELMRLGEAPAPRGRAPAAILHFGRNGSLGGTLSCNDGGIRTMWTGGGGFLPVGTGFEQTAVGCNDPAGEAFGRRFWGGLEQARSWRRAGDRLFITLANGTEAELRYLL